ncbi:hypothetical protein [Mucilaginibacter gotjawali]|uniref:Uncharacterized protein n=2 Tax=Mucilaginibacter gotjawali TaxID=1550579 RepID=A0A110B0W1_9SPHI|nr:hypothetical protein [Mucilaginibacter gotjawali]MBB3057803.1 hypothetical protein [Mucilaginibacter gotjawali]BAU52605.1 hypothetical protein MgSA37_00767 [Mucilaginibacter gotjawali]
MKKYLFLLPLLLLGSAKMYGQSIKFDQLVNLATLNNDAVYATLKQGNAFKQDYLEEVDGQQMEYFNSIGAKPGSEKIAAGSFVKLYNGTVLRTLEYTSTDVQNIINMAGQAKRYGLDLLFRGVDETDNIYLYSNSLYMVNIRIRRDQTMGVVEIKQKEYLGLE